MYKLLFHKGSIKKKVLKYGTPKPSDRLSESMQDWGSYYAIWESAAAFSNFFCQVYNGSSV